MKSAEKGEMAEREASEEAMAAAEASSVAAKAAVLAAKLDLDEAAEEKASLEAELAEVQRARSLPYAFEELDEVYRLLELVGPQRVAFLVLSRAALAYAVVSLLLRWRNDGFESVAGCLLMPLVCASGQI